MEPEVRGIFVFGKERSGTKWITNLIANHPDVACIQSEKHNGVHETNIFSQMPNAFGPLHIHENRLAFYHTFTNTFYFAISGVAKEWVFAQTTTSYLVFYELFMQEFARIRQCKHWVQKTNSSNYRKIRTHFKHQKAVIITRDLHSTLTSSLFRKNEAVTTTALIANTLRYVYLDRYEKQFTSDKNTLYIHYSALKKHTDQTLQRVYDFIGIDYSNAYLTSPFAANTTFGETSRKRLSGTQKAVIGTTKFIAQLLPMSLLRFLRNKAQQQRKDGRRFVVGTFD